jgi:ParB-like nuclease domain
MPAKKQKLHFEDDAAQTRIENVATAEIRADQLVQPRARLDPSVIAEYCERMLDGVEFPPVAVVRVDGEYLLVDGFLRFAAAKLANQKTLRCEVRRGDLRTALLLSVEANARHGLRRTWDDKRRAVGQLLNDAEWSKWSDREIARRCSVSHDFVGQQRGLTGNVASERRFVSKHGTEAVMNITAIGSKKTAPPAPITLTAPPPSSETLPPISITAPPRSETGEVVSLSDFAQNHREQFVAGLRDAEEIFAGLPPITAIRGDPAADDVLAKRLTALAEKAAWLAKLLLRE